MNPQIDYYDMHVEECKYCHSINMTYLMCSGFCVEPTKEDFDNYCAVRPEEPCKDNIPHGSVL